MNFKICATDLPVITGHNPYKPKEEIYYKFWKKYYPFDFDHFKNYLKENKVEVKKEETNYDTIKRLVQENNINICSNLSKCLKSSDIGELNKNKNEIMKLVETKLPSEKKKEFKESFNSFTNTNFGIKFENKGGELYQQKTNNKILKSTKFHLKQLFEIENDDLSQKSDTWSIYGKIDGILEDKTIIEIKNRVNRLFYKLRDYEKVQCYAYMYALETQKCQLVEVLKKKEDQSINIIDIEFDDKFWEDKICDRVQEFIQDFYDFMDNPKRKMDLLKCV